MSEEPQIHQYTEDDFETLSWKDHIRQRPGMYIGKLGDGSNPDDGIYVLFKEIVDNAIDEYIMGYGKVIDITLQDNMVTVRDYGRGIPFGKLTEAVSKMNTGAKYGSAAFKKSVGLNGVGTKAVNATSTYFYIQSFRDGESRFASFSKGDLVEEGSVATNEKNGTLVKYTADPALYENYSYNFEFIETMLKNYAYLNRGLAIKFNGTEYKSKNGLLDLINDSLVEPPLYPVIHLIGEDIEIALTHGTENGENISSFVNGQNTRDGGTHLAALREAVVKTLKEFYKKDYAPEDVRQGIVGAISIGIQEPRFESQTKIKLGSTYMWEESRKDEDGKTVIEHGPTIRSFVNDFIKTNLDNYLHIHRDVASAIQEKIVASEQERKEISGIQKKTRERSKRANIYNKKLRDCSIHYNDKLPASKQELAEKTSIFITEL